MNPAEKLVQLIPEDAVEKPVESNDPAERALANYLGSRIDADLTQGLNLHLAAGPDPVAGAQSITDKMALIVTLDGPKLLTDAERMVKQVQAAFTQFPLFDGLAMYGAMPQPGQLAVVVPGLSKEQCGVLLSALAAAAPDEPNMASQPAPQAKVLETPQQQGAHAHGCACESCSGVSKSAAKSSGHGMGCGCHGCKALRPASTISNVVANVLAPLHTGVVM